MKSAKTILVVARDAALREAAFECLLAHGYRADAVGTWRAGLRRAHKDEYDLLLLEPGEGAAEEGGEPNPIPIRLPLTAADLEDEERWLDRIRQKLDPEGRDGPEEGPRRP